MSKILITRTHSLPLQEAKSRLERVAEDLQKRFGITSAWKASKIEFEGTYVRGYLELGEKSVEIYAELSFFLLPFKGRIKGELFEQLTLQGF